MLVSGPENSTMNRSGPQSQKCILIFYRIYKLHGPLLIRVSTNNPLDCTVTFQAYPTLLPDHLAASPEEFYINYNVVFYPSFSILRI